MRHDWNWELDSWRCRYSSLFGDQSWIETQAVFHIRIFLDTPSAFLKGPFKHWRQIITCETQIELRESGIEAQRLTSHLYSVVRNRDSSTPPQTRGAPNTDSILVVMDRRAASLKRLLNTCGR